jgi:O-antigen/teichoic acid export membrane protein
LAGYGVSQALRLAGNLILTRLLFPEAFGIMAIVQAVDYGVHMLTDVGVGTSIVQNEKGDSPDFLNTAWTVQIIRGFLAWGVLCILAWPLSKIYGQPLFIQLLPVFGLTAIISGFSSTKLDTVQRNIDAARTTVITIRSYALGLLSSILLAWVMRSVWAIVFGTLISNCLRVYASHHELHGVKNRFAWNRDALDHLRGFGRWIMLGSALTFLSVEGARLLIGAILDMRQLALFSLASTMNLMFWQATQQVAGRVFFPAYAEVHRSSPERLKAILHKARLTIVLPNWGLAVLFIFFGSKLMGTLYDARYLGSGTMLVFLAAGSLVGCLWRSYARALLAMGNAVTDTYLTAIQFVLQTCAIFIGYHFLGATGVVIGVAAANWIMYPVYAYVISRFGLWHPKLDLIMIAASLLIIVLAWPRFSVIA